MRINRGHIAFAHDVIMAAISFVLALSLRLGDLVMFFDRTLLWVSAGVFTVVCAAVFWSMRMYRGVWRYASLNDLITIVKSATLAILIFLVIMFVTTRLEALPRSLPLINWFVLIALLGGPRFLYRLFKDRRIDLSFDSSGDARVPVLLAGAGDAAETFIRTMARPGANYRVTGIVARTPGRVGRDIHNVEVLGTLDDIPAVVRELGRRGPPPQRLIVTDDSFNGADIKKLLDAAEALGMTLARLPALTDFRSGVAERVEVRPVDVEDLLGRPQAALDRTPVQRLLAGRRVLVTGAGGSIGRELVRQISAMDPARLTLVDLSEYNLFSIDNEVAGLHPSMRRDAVIADVRDRDRIHRLTEEYRPDLVFHAAALKHVPLVEANPGEGLTTNVIGTVNMADAARAAGARMFVQISTDKAVNPTSIMGASKRVAESYCQALEMARGDNGTRFVSVRFGNVLGSTGSVVELFRAQLARGGPLTVTHPEMMRYFMTVREAVELVLQASALGIDADGHDGRIFVLDMGEPVRIVDLAKQMIRLAGLTPDEDVKIEFIGPRPGEKLFEEIFHGAEPLVDGGCAGLLLARPRTVPLATVEAEIGAIADACKANDRDAMIAAIRRLVPEYGPGPAPLPEPAAAQ